MTAHDPAATQRRREVISEPRCEFSPAMSLPWLLRDRAGADPERIFAERRVDAGPFTPVTLGRLRSDVDAVAKGLIERGIEPGDSVGILAATRYEWTVLDFAILSAGGVVVPLYHTSSADQIEWICTDSDVRLLVAENEELAGKARALVGRTGLREVLVIDDGALDDLASGGTQVTDADLDARVAGTAFDGLSSIVYTSGTTGRPKGVELTHGNLVSHVMNGPADPSLAPVVLAPGSRTLLFLPLCHVFGRFAQMLCLSTGVVLGYAPDTKNLVKDLQEFHPTWLIVVPRVFETMYNRADATAGTGLAKRVFRWAAQSAIAYSRALERPTGPSLVLRLRRDLANRLVLHRLHDAMGGQVRYAISGGAALSTRLAHFFRGIGVLVMEGYGATETTAPATVNRPDRIRIGSIGTPYAGCSIAVDEHDEILVSGPNVFRGYHGNPEATAEALRDGWFVTGDLGSIDEDGTVWITGRKKEIIVTAGGKNVQPAVLENALSSHPLIGSVVVVGEGKPFIGALIALDETMLPSWMDNHGLTFSTAEQARREPAIRASLQQAIDRANEKVSRAESIRSFAIIPRSLTEHEGEISASSKVIRPVVLRHFADSMREIYGDQPTE